MNNNRSRYLIKEGRYLRNGFYSYWINDSIKHSIYNVETLILCSSKYQSEDDVCLDYTKSDYGLEQYGDLICNNICVKEICDKLFTNYKLIQYDEGVHDIFYSKKEVRDKAIFELINFLWFK